jgi:hypothetical protein
MVRLNIKLTVKFNGKRAKGSRLLVRLNFRGAIGKKKKDCRPLIKGQNTGAPMIISHK